MSFKFLLFVFVFISGCGVKSDPIHPDGTALPSILEEYSIDIDKDKNKDNKNKNKNQNKENNKSSQ